MAGEKPWTWFAQPQPDREYVALATYLPVVRWTALPTFWRYAVGSIRQLAHSDGLLGYSLRAAPLRRGFWTLTVWEDAAAIRRYVRNLPHRAAMRWVARSGMTSFHSARWTVAGAAVPPAWDVALARLAAS